MSPSLNMDNMERPELEEHENYSNIHDNNDKGNKIEIIADLTIGKSFFSETYKSFVTYEKSSDSIHVTNIDGPLKYLENKWFFNQKGNNSEVNFQVEFELKNRILNLLMIIFFDKGLKKVADAFEKRAIDLFKSS